MLYFQRGRRRSQIQFKASISEYLDSNKVELELQFALQNVHIFLLNIHFFLEHMYSFKDVCKV